MTYETRMQTHVKVRSNPPGLEAFLPPLPTELSARQQVTITVRAVHDDGSVDVDYRFDQFEFESNLIDRMPENLRPSARQAQRAFTSHMIGQTLTAHYDREGQLVGFEGADDVFAQLDAPMREPLREVLKLFLEQSGGGMPCPGHNVKRGEEWKHKLAVQPLDQLTLALGGESSFKYTGKTKYQGVKAGAVDSHFDNALVPPLDNLRKGGPLADLEARGMGLEIRMRGGGSGHTLLALDDGRVLQNHATIHQTVSAHLKAPPGAALPPGGPLALEIEIETVFEEDGTR